MWAKGRVLVVSEKTRSVVQPHLETEFFSTRPVMYPVVHDQRAVRLVA